MISAPRRDSNRRGLNLPITSQTRSPLGHRIPCREFYFQWRASRNTSFRRALIPVIFSLLQVMVNVQMLAELEEVIQFKLVPERREIIKEMWWNRLRVKLLCCFRNSISLPIGDSHRPDLRLVLTIV